MKTIFLNILTAFLIALAPNFANAHGEDKPGPNGGYIRMPGAYHTELILTAPNSAKVYLLDINWKNPVVKDSGVKISAAGIAKEGHSSGSKVKPTAFSDCKPAKDHFVCELPKNINLSAAGSLTVSSTRLKQSGGPAIYNLPLSFKPQPTLVPTKDDHHHHH